MAPVESKPWAKAKRADVVSLSQIGPVSFDDVRKCRHAVAAGHHEAHKEHGEVLGFSKPNLHVHMRFMVTCPLVSISAQDNRGIGSDGPPRGHEDCRDARDGENDGRKGERRTVSWRQAEQQGLGRSQ